MLNIKNKNMFSNPLRAPFLIVLLIGVCAFFLQVHFVTFAAEIDCEPHLIPKTDTAERFSEIKNYWVNSGNLRLGDRSDRVCHLQFYLKKRNYRIGTATTHEGKDFNRQTRNTLKLFQRGQRLSITGNFDQRTRVHLRREKNKNAILPPIPLNNPAHVTLNAAGDYTARFIWRHRTETYTASGSTHTIFADYDYYTLRHYTNSSCAGTPVKTEHVARNDERYADRFDVIVYDATIPFSESLSGTTRYLSIYTVLNGVESSRRTACIPYTFPQKEVQTISRGNLASAVARETDRYAVTLTWDTVPEATHYTISRYSHRTCAGIPFIYQRGADSSYTVHYEDVEFAYPLTHYYRVVGYSDGRESIKTNCESVTLREVAEEDTPEQEIDAHNEEEIAEQEESAGEVPTLPGNQNLNSENEDSDDEEIIDIVKFEIVNLQKCTDNTWACRFFNKYIQVFRLKFVHDHFPPIALSLAERVKKGQKVVVQRRCGGDGLLRRITKSRSVMQSVYAEADESALALVTWARFLLMLAHDEGFHYVSRTCCYNRVCYPPEISHRVFSNPGQIAEFNALVARGERCSSGSWACKLFNEYVKALGIELVREYFPPVTKKFAQRSDVVISPRCTTADGLLKIIAKNPPHVRTVHANTHDSLVDLMVLGRDFRRLVAYDSEFHYVSATCGPAPPEISHQIFSRPDQTREFIALLNQDLLEGFSDLLW